MNKQTLTINAKALDDNINIVVYHPHNVTQDVPVTIILYMFGDFLFHPFAGSLQYLSQELSLIPNAVLVGINDVQEKPIGPYQKEYAHFITHQLIESLEETYSLAHNCVLFGHSRATRLVAQVMQDGSRYISKFILSAPWLTDQQLSDLENAFCTNHPKMSVFITQSEEDLRRAAISDAHQRFLQMLEKYSATVKTKYRYFDGESHMTIPPLSFYYGLLYHLGP
jgi:hypothetical protein